MCHVLVIEDEPYTADYIAAIVVDAGATSFDIADTPAAAVAMALARPPAVILSDVQIVDGTGPEAVAEIRKQLGPLPVIFITATPEACERYDFAVAILTKPIMPRHVADVFRRIAPQSTRSN